jgi:hypothetical protein
LKHTIENQKLFSQFMLVRGETGMGRITHQAGGAGYLIAISFEHFSINANNRGALSANTLRQMGYVNAKYIAGGLKAYRVLIRDKSA